MTTGTERGGPPGRTPNPRGQGERLRGEIVDAAGELLADRGVEALSLRAVARAVGVSPPAVYLHFADKHALVWAVLQQRFTELHHTLTAAAGHAAASDDDQERAAGLRAWCRAYVEFGLAHPGHYRMLFESWNAREVTLPLTELPGGPVFASLVELTAESLGTREAARNLEHDAARTATLLWAGLHGIVSLRINKPSFPWPPSQHLVDDLLRRILTTGPV